ncbi:MAG TPA: hypothetical protein VG944_11630 [Fimbriimonas sp.]|nr:hypothetical protein [Fimbriimonas sp.]
MARSKLAWKLATASLSLLAVLALPAAGQVRKTPRGYSLTARYRAGTIQKFKAELAIGGVTDDPKHGLAVAFGVNVAVEKVSRGIASLRLEMGGASPVANLPIKQQVTRVRVDAHNHVVDAGHSNKSLLAVAYFPKHPVRLNEKWVESATIPLSGVSGGLVETTYKLVGVKTDHNKTIANLALTFEGFARGEGSVLVDCADGSVLTSVMTLRVHPSKGQSRLVPLVIVLKRLGR